MEREEKLANMFTITNLIKDGMANILVKVPKDKLDGFVDYFRGLSEFMFCSFNKVKDDLSISCIIMGRKITLLLQESDYDSFTYMKNVQY